MKFVCETKLKPYEMRFCAREGGSISNLWEVRMESVRSERRISVMK